MNLKLIAYGISKDIIQGREKTISLDVKNIRELKTYLTAEFPDFTKLSKLSFAVGEEYRDDDFELKEGDEVVIIPPVSGG